MGLKEKDESLVHSNPPFRDFLRVLVDQALALATRTSRWGILPKEGDLSPFSLALCFRSMIGSMLVYCDYECG